MRPHLAVDCHEFGRDPKSRRAKGWRKWPDITMDGLEQPALRRRVVAAAGAGSTMAAAAEAKAGHPFLRYWVGGRPPDGEQRHSAPDIDSGLNALGMYGGLSFIIEAAAPEGAAPPGDLGNRVDAYLVLSGASSGRQPPRGGPRRDRARPRAPLPAFLPANYLWVNPGTTVTEFPVVETATGRV